MRGLTAHPNTPKYVSHRARKGYLIKPERPKEKERERYEPITSLLQAYGGLMPEANLLQDER